MNTFPNKETQWQPGQSGNKSGRPVSQLANLQQMAGQQYDIQLTKQDITHLLHWLIEKPFKELAIIKQEPELPAFMVSLIEALEKDLKKHSIRTLEMIFDRIFGKPVYSNNMTFGKSNLVELLVKYEDEKKSKE